MDPLSPPNGQRIAVAPAGHGGRRVVQGRRWSATAVGVVAASATYPLRARPPVPPGGTLRRIVQRRIEEHGVDDATHSLAAEIEGTRPAGRGGVSPAVRRRIEVRGVVRGAGGRVGDATRSLAVEIEGTRPAPGGAA